MTESKIENALVELLQMAHTKNCNVTVFTASELLYQLYNPETPCLKEQQDLFEQSDIVTAEGW